MFDAAQSYSRVKIQIRKIKKQKNIQKNYFKEIHSMGMRFINIVSPKILIFYTLILHSFLIYTDDGEKQLEDLITGDRIVKDFLSETGSQEPTEAKLVGNFIFITAWNTQLAKHEYAFERLPLVFLAFDSIVFIHILLFTKDKWRNIFCLFIFILIQILIIFVLKAIIAMPFIK